MIAPCPHPGFDPGIPWSIPRRAFRFAEQGDATAAIALHATLDLDGDERPDFVVTFDRDRGADDLAWSVHRNTGSGFDATPMRWPVPFRAFRAHEQGDASAALHLHSTFDIDGDLRPDFVETFDSGDGTGTTAWSVHRNTGSGFEATATRWPIPRPAFHVDEQGDPTAAAALWTTIDVTGDRRPDFVVTFDRDDPSAIDAMSWWVYPNTGSGFASTPERWTIPVRARRATEQGDPLAAVSLFTLLDMDGDERPDFVRTYDIDGSAGDGAWLVHRNTGHGFETSPRRWNVPGRMARAAEQGDATAAIRLYATRPRVRRGAHILDVTFDTSGTGTDAWLRYENTGSSFAASPVSWPIPGRALRFFEQGDASAAIALHGTFDLDGDGASDFVETYERDSSVGITEWRLHRACAP